MYAKHVQNDAKLCTYYANIIYRLVQKYVQIGAKNMYILVQKICTDWCTNYIQIDAKICTDG